ISKFYFQGAGLAQAAKSAVYNQFFQKLRLNEDLLEKAWELNTIKLGHPDPIIDLKQLAQDLHWDGLNQLENTINQGLHSINSELNFKITSLTFNTSTYELHAQFELRYDHDWGTLKDIGHNVINAVHNWAQSEVSKAQNWFKKELGALAKDWQDWNAA